MVVTKARSNMRLIMISLLMVFVTGCATLRVDKQFWFDDNAVDRLKSEITVDKSTKNDVLKIFGQPHIKSVNEVSSVELPKVPLLDRLDFFPHETWTYIKSRNGDSIDPDTAIKVLGVGVLSKKLKIVNVFFNEKGKVLGYLAHRHTIQ